MAVAPFRGFQPMLGSVRCYAAQPALEIHYGKDDVVAPPELAEHLRELNQRQLEAVIDHSSTAVSVIAGPGSGKTRVIVSRVHELVDGPAQILPEIITVITFTPDELQGRLKPLLDRHLASGEGGDQTLFAGTFHSFCQRFLERYGRAMDPSLRDVNLLTDDKQKGVIKEAESVQSVLGTLRPQIEVNQIAKDFSEKLSVLKGQLHTVYGLKGRAAIEVAINKIQEQSPHKSFQDLDVQEFADCYDAYTSRMRAESMMDYDDLLSLTAAMMSQRDEKAVQQFKRAFKHVLVDEFQDTNTPQYAILKGMHAAGTNIFVVGDADQAIYGWRGAQPDNMAKSFQEDFGGAPTHVLKRNHRSLPAILYAAALINNQGKRVAAGTQPPLLQDFREDHNEHRALGEVTVVTVDTGRGEAAWVAKEIKRLHAKENVPLGNIAVLFRTNRQSVLLEEALHLHDVSFVLPKRQSFWTSPECAWAGMGFKFGFLKFCVASASELLDLPGASRMFDLLLQAEEADSSFSAGDLLFSDIPPQVTLPVNTQKSEVKALLKEVLENSRKDEANSKRGKGKTSPESSAEETPPSLLKSIVDEEAFPPSLSLAPPLSEEVIQALFLSPSDPEGSDSRGDSSMLTSYLCSKWGTHSS
eukprot:gene8639-34087_t